MGIEIIDGKGSGLAVGVTSENELLAHARVESHLAHASRKVARAFWVASGFVALTSTGIFNGVLYLKNTSEDRIIFIHKIRTSAEMAQQWKLIKNPTAGTLVSEAEAAHVENLAFSSSNVITGDAYRAAADGKTVTDGDHASQWALGAGVLPEDLGGALFLATNDSVALVCKPGVAGDVGATFLITQEIRVA